MGRTLSGYPARDRRLERLAARRAALAEDPWVGAARQLRLSIAELAELVADRDVTGRSERPWVWDVPLPPDPEARAQGRVRSAEIRAGLAAYFEERGV